MTGHNDEELPPPSAIAVMPVIARIAKGRTAMRPRNTAPSMVMRLRTLKCIRR